MHRDLKPENIMFVEPLPAEWRGPGALQGTLGIGSGLGLGLGLGIVLSHSP